ncbi:MAG TPA: hypothetical protein PKL78_02650 [Anaerolineales bacterium]|nr:hypothetical protein [Anaerolineales bacterium]HNO32198.1 hypothetical protein [Anaerolineales bacterium]
MTLSPDLISGALSFLFTILILSYVIGDNPLFRVAIYVFVGVASGYVASVVIWQVLVPRLITPLVPTAMSNSPMQWVMIAVPLLGSILVFAKISQRLSGLARFSMAYLVGVGAAVTVAGAMIGTLLPQVQSTIEFFDPQIAAARSITTAEVVGNGAIILLGVVTSLIYFHFGAHQKTDGTMRRLLPIEILAWIGRIFIGITLGAVFAGVYATALTALIERLSSLINFFGLFS